MAFKKAYENAPPKEEIPVNEFLERIPTELALELQVVLTHLPKGFANWDWCRLLVADYLEGM